MNQQKVTVPPKNATPTTNLGLSHPGVTNSKSLSSNNTKEWLLRPES